MTSTKLWTATSNQPGAKWELYGDVRTDEIAYHVKKIRSMCPGLYVRMGQTKPTR